MNLAPFRKLSYPGGSRRVGIDPTHPASVGLVSGRGASVVTSGANMVNLLTGKPCTLGGTPTKNTYGLMGQGTTFSASGQFSSVTGQSTASITSATFAAIQRSTTASANMIVTIANGSLGLWWLSGTSLGFWTGSNLGVITLSGANKELFVAGSINGSVAYCVATDLSNGHIYSGSNIGGAPPTPNGTTMFGNNQTFTGDVLNGSMAVGMYSPTFVPPNELLAWAADPWGFWYPPTANNIYALSLAGVPGSVGTITAQASVSGVGTGAIASAGSATGQAAVAGVGQELVASVGSITGQAAVAGIGQDLSKSKGTATGHASVLGIPVVTKIAAGEADGVANVLGRSKSVQTNVDASTGTITGTSAVQGFSPTPAVGEADGQASVQGVGTAVQPAIGTITAQSFVQGISFQPALNAGSILIAGL